MLTFRFRCHMGDPTKTHLVTVRAHNVREAWATFDASRRDGEVVVGQDMRRP
jgi:hypothetical protein